MNFLFSHAAGKPIKALRIAEIFDEEVLYREASRFVLDNPGMLNQIDNSRVSSSDAAVSPRNPQIRWLVS